MRTTVDLGKQASGGSFVVNLELFDFGTSVKVQTPPADQVVEGDAAGLGALGFSGLGTH